MNNPPPPPESLYGDLENRIRFIEDLFYSHFILYPRDRFYFHDTANITLLLFQQPLAIVGFERKAAGLRRVWHSVFDREFLRDFDRCYSADRRGGADGPTGHLVAIPGTDFVIGLYHWDAETAPPGTNPFRPVQDGPGTPSDLLKRLFQRMAADPDAGKVLDSPGALFRNPYDHWKQWRGQKRQPGSAARPVAVAEADIDRYLERIRADLLEREIYAAIKESPLLTRRCCATPDGGPVSADSTAPFPNIWFILRTGSDTPRTRKGRFRYSLRYLFPQEQLLAIVSHLQRQHQAATGGPPDRRGPVPPQPTLSFPGWDGRDNTGIPLACCPHYAGQGRCAVPNMGHCLHGDVFAAAAGWTDTEWRRAVAALLESPLGPHARLIADSAFRSGCVEFPDAHEALGQGRLRVDDDNPRDRNRVRLLSCLKHQIHRHPKGIIYPILVSGSPWLAITTGLSGQASGTGDGATGRSSPAAGEDTPAEGATGEQPSDRQQRAGHRRSGTAAAGIPPSAWMSTFHFVHSLLRRLVVDRLRLRAERLYLTLLAEEFQHANELHFENWVYHDPEGMVKELNQAFARLTVVFPFRQVEAGITPFHSTAESRGFRIPILAGKELHFRLTENAYFDRIIPSSARSFLPLEKVVETFISVVGQEESRIKQEANQQKKGAERTRKH